MTDSSPAEVEAALAGACAFGASTPQARAGILNALAELLESNRDELVLLAREESHLPKQRLDGELSRTIYQLRRFAAAVVEGSCFDAVVEPADPDHPLGPRPDLRRVSEPVGPVLVFAASNFPFAFSVLGGDTAAALAAGCAVIVKAHPGHPRLSRRVGELALAGGAPVAVVRGISAGRQALLDARVKAAAFTGSTSGGRVLFDLAASRPDPIPFYGELGSINPVFVSPAAVAARGQQLVEGFVGSFTLGVGQFCTKPGVLFLPAGHGLEETLAAAVRAVPAAPMLGPWIEQRYAETLAERQGDGSVRPIVAGDGTAPTLLSAKLHDLVGTQLVEECFGPTSLVVEYDGALELLEGACSVEGSLTATIHAEDSDVEWARALIDVVRSRVGRIVWNGWPTGVAVSPAMHHGGPWPASTAPGFSSVGGNAITRFLRPVAYQGLPDALLPAALQQNNPLGIHRRVEGELR